MSNLNDRLTELEKQLVADFPSFEAFCAKRWGWAGWMRRLADEADTARVRAELGKLVNGLPVDDNQLRAMLLDGQEPGLPAAGSVPTNAIGAPESAPPLQKLPENTMPN